ncbi:TPA: hypothetical protein ACQYF6_000053 [Vibrio parahaemolyticus]
MNQMFSSIQHAMDEAKNEQNFFIFRSRARQLGLTEVDEETVVSIRYSYSLDLPNNLQITGSLRSWDQSGPFSIQPDKNVIEFKLLNNGQVLEQYEVSWED